MTPDLASSMTSVMSQFILAIQLISMLFILTKLLLTLSSICKNTMHKPRTPDRRRATSSSQLRSKLHCLRGHRLIAQPTRSPESQTQIQDLDLDLKSLWFAKEPAAFPPATINRLPGKRTYASSSGWSSSGVRRTYTFTGAIRDTTTLGTTIIHLTWDGSNPGLTVKAQQRHIPPPRKLSQSELDSYRDQ